MHHYNFTSDALLYDIMHHRCFELKESNFFYILISEHEGNRFVFLITCGLCALLLGMSISE